MTITGVNNYNSVYENTYASSRKEAAKKEEIKETAAAQKSTETAKKNSKSNNATEYANGLAKLVPSAEFRIGDGFSTAKTGITLTVSPKLLEKMQNDPETEKEMKELIKGVEAKNKLAEKWNKMTGRTTVFRHDWIDANGEFHSFSQTIRKDELNEKLRKEAQENAEKRIEKSREKVRENAEQLNHRERGVGRLLQLSHNCGSPVDSGADLAYLPELSACAITHHGGFSTHPGVGVRSVFHRVSHAAAQPAWAKKSRRLRKANNLNSRHAEVEPDACN